MVSKAVVADDSGFVAVELALSPLGRALLFAETLSQAVVFDVPVATAAPGIERTAVAGFSNSGKYIVVLNDMPTPAAIVDADNGADVASLNTP